MSSDFVVSHLGDEDKKFRFCRFCGIEEGTEKSKSFTELYSKSNWKDKSLFTLTNSYLPLKVENGSIYPQIICSSCYTSLQHTIEFFDKIANGQKILSRVWNQSKGENNVKAFSSSEKSDSSFQFSSENPISQALPKKRGRPKKDPNQPVKKLSPIALDPSEIKPKRLSRKPTRYQADAPVVIKEEVEDLPTQDVPAPDPFLSFKHAAPKVPGDSLTFTTFTPRDNLMELGRLSVIMDGDEELETQALEEEGKKKGVKKDNDIEEIENEVVNDESDCGSDVSVRTIDLFIKKRRKKITKRKKNNTKPKKECDECGKLFMYKSSLKYHKISVHQTEKQFSCTICGKQFAHKSLLTNHINTHSKTRNFKCECCILTFKSKASLYTHVKSIHEKGSHVCDTCGYSFTLRSSLKAHQRIHTGEKPFTCDFCGKTFTQRSNMREHVRTHTGERPYKCNFEGCDKAFTTASQVRNHKLLHSGHRPYLCSLCGKTFSHGENFKYHMRRHTGEKPLECPICQKLFTEPWSLKKHWRFHTGEKPYSCEICKKQFSDCSNYAKHKKTHLLEQDLSQQVAVIPSDATQSSTTEIDNGIVHIISDNLNALEGNEEGQIIYVYPDDLPVFTITLNDPQSIEVRSDGEGNFPLGMAGGQITFVEAGDIPTQFFNLESVTTIDTPKVDEPMAVVTLTTENLNSQ